MTKCQGPEAWRNEGTRYAATSHKQGISVKPRIVMTFLLLMIFSQADSGLVASRSEVLWDDVATVRRFRTAVEHSLHLIDLL